MQEPAPPEPDVRLPFFVSMPPLQLILLGISLVFLQQLLVGTVGGWSPNLYLTLAASALLVFYALPLWLLRRARAPWRTTLRLLPISPIQTVLTVVAALAVVLPMNLLGEWNLRWLPPPETFVEFLEDLTPEGPAEWVLATLSVVVVVPIGEEIVFRGIMQQAARQGLRGPVAAVLVGVLFGVLHFEPWYVTGLAVAGVAMGFALEITGSLLAPILLHAVYNAVALAALTVPDESLPAWIGSSPAGIAVAILSAGVAVVAFRALRTVSRPRGEWDPYLG